MYPSSSSQIVGDSFLNSKYFDPAYLFDRGADFLHYIFGFHSLGGLNFILSILALFFSTLIFYCAIRLFEIRAKEHKHLKQELAEYAHHQAEREQKKREGESVSSNPRWVQVLQYITSSNPADWRLAIIEADAMLESLMRERGFQGEGLGDMLKSATQENFRPLSTAWEVHTVRNRIAHEGGSFELSSYEAKRVIALYEQIFREFGYI